MLGREGVQVGQQAHGPESVAQGGGVREGGAATISEPARSAAASRPL
jgi:hypothetical protein